MQWITDKGETLTLGNGVLKIDNPNNPEASGEFSLTDKSYSVHMGLTETWGYIVQLNYFGGQVLNCGVYSNATYAASLMVALVQRLRVEH